MREFLVGKQEIIDLLCIQHLTIKQAAARVGVTEKTFSKYSKVYKVDARDWWKYQQIFCPECGKLIDPDVQLGEKERKALIKKGHVLCDECKKDKRRDQDKVNKRNWRAEHREEYNNYQRELMRKRKAEQLRKEQEGQ
jgi:hypothetical protein